MTKLIAQMVVRNEADRYLEEVLKWDAENIEAQNALIEIRQQRGESKDAGKGFTLFRKG